MPENFARIGRMRALGPLYPFLDQAALLLGLFSFARFVDAMTFREHLDGGSLVVLRPGKSALTRCYPAEDRVPAGDAVLPDLSRTALAQASWASPMSREGRYQ